MKATSTNDPIQFADGVAAAPGIPVVGAGANLATLRFDERYGRIRLLLASGAVTLTAPVTIYGERSGEVCALGVLNDGEDIVLTSPGGFAPIVQFVGTYDFFGLNPAGIVGGGTYDGYIESIGTLDVEA